MKTLTILLCGCVIGCAAANAHNHDYKSLAAVSLGAASIQSPAVVPAVQTTCDECNGTKKVRTGDGLALVDCPCGASCQCKASVSPLALRVAGGSTVGTNGLATGRDTVPAVTLAAVDCSSGVCRPAQKIVRAATAPVRAVGRVFHNRPVRRWIGSRPIRRLFGRCRGC